MKTVVNMTQADRDALVEEVAALKRLVAHIGERTRYHDEYKAVAEGYWEESYDGWYRVELVDCLRGGHVSGGEKKWLVKYIEGVDDD